jgi:hypothetical protein
MKTTHDQFVEEFKDMPFVKEGIYFGYPPCCILEFVMFIIDYKKGIKTDNRGARKFHGTGYVPCAECNNKTEEELLSHIEKHRKCELSFPNQPRKD